jgi:hypothetical protein
VGTSEADFQDLTEACLLYLLFNVQLMFSLAVRENMGKSLSLKYYETSVPLQCSCMGLPRHDSMPVLETKNEMSARTGPDGATCWKAFRSIPNGFPDGTISSLYNFHGQGALRPGCKKIPNTTSNS